MKSPGFTLIESCVAAAILLILMGTALGVVGEMTYFVGTQNARCGFAVDASLAFTKLDRELRKCGATVVNNVAYPYLSGGGTALHFVRLVNLPRVAAGAVEPQWGTTEYTLKTAEDGELCIWESGAKRVIICRNVVSTAFMLAGNRITIDLVLERIDERGNATTESARRVIVMRNSTQ